MQDAQLLHNHLSVELRANPFLSDEDIFDILEKEICASLDRDLDEYCDSDDYYEPYLDDFVGEGTYDSEEAWKSWGLELIDFSGSGDIDWERY